MNAFATPAPLAEAPLPSLRVLTGFVVCTAPAALEEAGILPAGSRPRGACAALYPALAAVIASPGRRGALDALLRDRLGTEARPFERLGAAELGRRVERESAGWPVETLLALLWSLARRPAAPFRPLEQRVLEELRARGGWPLPGG